MLIPYGFLCFGIYDEFVNFLMYCFNQNIELQEFAFGGYHYVVLFSNNNFHNLIAYCQEQRFIFLKFYCRLF